MHLKIWKRLRLPAAPPPRHRQASSNKAIVRVRWYCLVILICIFLMANDMENFSGFCLLVIWICLFVKWLSKPFVHFYFFCLLVIDLYKFFIYLYYESIMAIFIINHLLPVCDLSFHFLINIFWWIVVPNVMKSDFNFFSLWWVIIVYSLFNLCLAPRL